MFMARHSRSGARGTDQYPGRAETLAGATTAPRSRRGQLVDRAGAVVADEEVACGAGDDVDRAAPAFPVGFLEAGDQRLRRQQGVALFVPREPEDGGWPGLLAVPGPVR